MATNYSNNSSEDKELLDIVDQTGKVVGKSSRDKIYKEGLLHPAVNILVFNKNIEMFIQRRSQKKFLPLYWDISASEHVKSGENYKLAAIRGLKEELSFTTSVKLLRKKHIQRNTYKSGNAELTEYELVETYGAIHNGKIKINHDEIIEGKYISLKNLIRLLENPDNKFTPWGLDEIDYFLKNSNIIAELIH